MCKNDKNKDILNILGILNQKDEKLSQRALINIVLSVCKIANDFNKANWISYPKIEKAQISLLEKELFKYVGYECCEFKFEKGVDSLTLSFQDKPILSLVRASFDQFSNEFMVSLERVITCGKTNMMFIVSKGYIFGSNGLYVGDDDNNFIENINYLKDQPTHPVSNFKYYYYKDYNDDNKIYIDWGLGIREEIIGGVWKKTFFNMSNCYKKIDDDSFDNLSVDLMVKKLIGLSSCDDMLCSNGKSSYVKKDTN